MAEGECPLRLRGGVYDRFSSTTAGPGSPVLPDDAQLKLDVPCACATRIRGGQLIWHVDHEDFRPQMPHDLAELQSNGPARVAHRSRDRHTLAQMLVSQLRSTPCPLARSSPWLGNVL